MLDDGASKPVSLLPRSDDQAALQRLVSKLRWRLLPLLCSGFTLAMVDRANISFAELQSEPVALRQGAAVA
eukprot:2425198-Prymnesium_polylepis.1